MSEVLQNVFKQRAKTVIVECLFAKPSTSDVRFLNESFF